MSEPQDPNSITPPWPGATDPAAERITPPQPGATDPGSITPPVPVATPPAAERITPPWPGATAPADPAADSIVPPWPIRLAQQLQAISDELAQHLREKPEVEAVKADVDSALVRLKALGATTTT